MLKTICASGFLLGTLVVISGCGVPSEPVWLTDSSSFIYAKSDGSVVQYDVAKAASRTLQEKGKCQPRRAAVSPTGDRVAVGVAAWGAKSSAVGIGIYRLSDGALIDTKTVKWGDPSGGREFRPSGAYWCPSGKRVLICYASGEKGQMIEAAVYNLETKSLRQVSGKPPMPGLFRLLGVSPLRPDGAGYLTISLKNEGIDLWFVEWDGWEHKIEMDAPLQELLSPLNDKSDSAQKKQGGGFVPQGGWQGNVLSFAVRGGKVSIDTQKQIASYVETSALGQRNQPALEGVIDVADFHDGRYQVVYKVQAGQARVELREPAKKRSRLIIGSVESYSGSPRALMPSPDGKFVLVQVVKKGRRTIFVIGSDGATLAELDCGPP